MYFSYLRLSPLGNGHDSSLKKHYQSNACAMFNRPTGSREEAFKMLLIYFCYFANIFAWKLEGFLF